MCGIIGIASNKPVSSNIIQSLKRLEYRGYDSAGIATIVKEEIDEKKCTGRVDNLRGLKENVIVGHKIPAGTGLREYDNIIVGSKEEFDEMMEEKQEVNYN